MTAEIVPVRKFRKEVPEAHKTSIDTRLRWLWHQRYGTVQTIFSESRDVLDHTACVLILQAIMAKDLQSIEQLFQRLEGGAVADRAVLNRKTMRL